MKLKHILYTTLSIVFFSCTNGIKNDTITRKSDYDSYLNYDQDEVVSKAKENLSFWENKLQQSPNQYPYLSKIASANSHLFTITGNISYLKEAEKNLLKINQKVVSAGNLRALARNYISQHKFKEALQFLAKAEKNGEQLAATHKMLFDVHLELGQNKEAQHYLSLIEKYADFDYYIRAGKWNDHKGNLDAAIENLENALSIAKFKNNKELLVWSYTNLADFYGHNNQIKKSYTYYLKALAIQPYNHYAKKGIAWIVYSHEKNPQEALRILKKVKVNSASPDYSLLLAEIYEFMNNTDKKEEHLNSFLAEANNHSYGVMYHTHKAKLYLDEWNQTEKASSIILEELDNRATAESYSLLAWSAYKKGKFEKALSIAKEHIEGKSFEPELLYHLAEIYKANGLTEKTHEIKKELLECQYELGPVTFSKIQRL